MPTFTYSDPPPLQPFPIPEGAGSDIWSIAPPANPYIGGAVAAGGGGGGSINTPTQEFDFAHELIKVKLEMATTKKKVSFKSQYSAPLSYPIVAENNPDGTKRLWTTRYNKLESLYGVLYENVRNFETAYKEQLESNGSLLESIGKMDREIKLLKAENVDSAVVKKRMDQVCKELGITLPPSRYNNLEQQLNAFFGAIWVRLRVEVVDDQLAE